MSTDGLEFLGLTDAQEKVLADLGVSDAPSLLAMDALALRAAMGRTAGRRRALATRQQVEDWCEKARAHVDAGLRSSRAARDIAGVTRWESAAGFTVVFERRGVSGGATHQISVEQTDRAGEDLSDPPTVEIEGWDLTALRDWIHGHLPEDEAPAPPATSPARPGTGPDLRVVGVRITDGHGEPMALVAHGEVTMDEASLSGESMEISLVAPAGAESPQVALRTRQDGDRTWSTTSVAEADADTVGLVLTTLVPGRYEAKLVAWVPGLPSLVTLHLPPLIRV
ncbi:MAG: hypothetical protein H6531_08400 [Actinobacteria bacterium]|nr:hypothetical protein [Thermoleophilia bacterium]MCB9011835.1 hypothetical protein [Actinomycetota bacterium]